MAPMGIPAALSIPIPAGPQIPALPVQKSLQFTVWLWHQPLDSHINANLIPKRAPQFYSFTHPIDSQSVLPFTESYKLF